MVKRSTSLAALLLGAIPLWLLFVVPRIERVPSNFQYQADIASYDNFFDEQKNAYSGEKRSITKFSYEVANSSHGVLIIRNAFDVHTVTGEKIFTVERLYGIDPVTGKHVLGFGDYDREGYLFAPHHLKKGEPYTYWHINYDGPAHMQFVGEETLLGLPVYRYETDYKGVTIDQTKNLGTLPGVGVTRGVRLEPSLQVWIEPVSGHMVKYKDDTIAYYYDLKTGIRQNPWNHFSNSYTPESIANHIEIARKEKSDMIVVEDMIPALFGMLGMLMILFRFRRSKAVKFGLFIVVTIAVLVSAGMWLVSMFRQPAPTAMPMTTVRIGTQQTLDTSPFWIAEHNGYFESEGIHLEITERASGRTSLQEMLTQNNVDVVTVGETPVVLNSFEHDTFRVIAGLSSSSNDNKILARKDRGILRASDLKGKKVGVTIGSTGHYFLGLFLANEGLALTDVSVTDIEPSALPQALADGLVDAISTTTRSIFTAQKMLGDNALLLEQKGIFRSDSYLVARKSWADDHPEVMIGFLKAIDKAEIFIQQHENEAVGIIAERFKLDQTIPHVAWQDYSFRLFLDQAILLSLEQQARWMMTNKFTERTAAPNFLDFIYFDALQAIKPEAVTIIR